MISIIHPTYSKTAKFEALRTNFPPAIALKGVALPNTLTHYLATRSYENFPKTNCFNVQGKSLKENKYDDCNFNGLFFDFKKIVGAQEMCNFTKNRPDIRLPSKIITQNMFINSGMKASYFQEKTKRYNRG